MQEHYEAEYIGDTPPPEDNQDPPQQEEQQQTDYEAEARKQGWKPQEEFDGPPDKWRSARAFVDRGNSDPKILQTRVEKLGRALDQERRRSEEREKDYQDRFDRLTRTQEMALQRQREQIEAQFANVKRQAAAEGDTELYDRVEKEETQVKQAWADEDKQRQEQATPKADSGKPELQPDVQSWIERNPWFNKDRAMTDEAMAYETYLAQSQPGLATQDRLEKTREHIVSQFPHKFGRKQQRMSGQQRNGSPVDGGQRQPGAPSDDNGFSQLPSEARQQFKAFVKDGIFKDNADDRGQYAKYYNNPNADKAII